MTPNQRHLLADLEVDKLPSLPHVLVEMLEACQSHQASFQTLSGIISRDAGIAARVISLANSSFYNRGAAINSLERALFVLGTDALKTLVITVSVQQFFSGFGQNHSQYLKKFWKRSLTSALIAKSLAILTSYPNPDEAYLTGLLHNIGELVLRSNYPKRFAQYEDVDSDTKLLEFENSTFEIDHAHIGGWLAKEWGLNNFTADAIEFHHAPLEAIRDAHHLTKLCYLSGVLSHDQALELSENFTCATELFELNPSLVNEIIIKINKDVLLIANSMNIDIDASSDATNKDQETQIALARHVRNISLIQSGTQDLKQALSLDQLSQSLQCAVELLFGFKYSAIFWYDAENNELKLHTTEKDAAPIIIRCESERSAVSDSLLRKETISTNDIPESDRRIVDKQICRLLVSEEIFCTPLHSGDAKLGVLCIGEESKHDKKLPALFDFFIHEASRMCAQALAQIGNFDANLSAQELQLKAHEIAHEANNPLTIIANYLGALGHKLSNDEAIQEDLTILKEEVERTGSILLQLRDLQSVDPEQELTQINTEIKRLTKLYEGALFLTHKIDYTLELDPSLQELNIKQQTVRQILTNLIKNASEAMTDGGELFISTQSNVNINGKNFVEIIIKDNGPGIPEAILMNLFNPVNSTKGKGHSGLGLCITKNLVTDAQGTISCKSNKNGTEFQIHLPHPTGG